MLDTASTLQQSTAFYLDNTVYDSFRVGAVASDDEMEAHAKAGGGQHQDIESSPVPASFMYLSIPLQGRRTPAFGAFGVMPSAVRQRGANVDGSTGAEL